MHALDTTSYSFDQNGDTGRAHLWIVYIGMLCK